jgi:ATP citrate (pro-S)-lyase
VKLNQTWPQVCDWIRANAFKPITVEGVQDELHTFVIEPFFPHAESEEMYVSLQNVREGTLVYFYHQGGVHVGDVDQKAAKYLVPIRDSLTEEAAITHLLQQIKEDTDRATLAQFLVSLFRFYMDYNYSFLEINPFVLKAGKIVVLDCAAKLDSAAQYCMGAKWGEHFTFVSPFGKSHFVEEEKIRALDESSGASLKLTVLNIKGRIWTMVAGGGASVVYTDCILNLGGKFELANYGEYSGNPNTYLTHQYAEAIVSLILKFPHPEGKLLIVGGGIANFTDVHETFKGIIQAFQSFAKELRDAKVKILVRRGGPNAEQGSRFFVIIIFFFSIFSLQD